MARRLAQQLGRSKYALILHLAACRGLRAEDFLHGCLLYSEMIGRDKAARALELSPARLKLALAMAAAWTPSTLASGRQS